jgi:hypothetical protein
MQPLRVEAARVERTLDLVEAGLDPPHAGFLPPSPLQPPHRLRLYWSRGGLSPPAPGSVGRG